MKIHLYGSVLFSFAISTAGAALESNQVREALSKKTESYLKEGLFSGGDREVHSGVVKDIRRAVNAGFERVVVDIESEKTPYYQVAVDSSERRILITIFGMPKIAIHAKKIVEQFRKSSLIDRVEFFPLLEEDAWTFALYLRGVAPVEVFELGAPTRIILDLKAGQALVSEAAPRVVKKPALKPKTPPVDELERGNGAANHAEDIPE